MIFMLFFEKALTAAFLSFNVNLENQITFCFSIKIHFLSDPFAQHYAHQSSFPLHSAMEMKISGLEVKQVNSERRKSFSSLQVKRDDFRIQCKSCLNSSGQLDISIILPNPPVPQQSDAN